MKSKMTKGKFHVHFYLYSRNSSDKSDQYDSSMFDNDSKNMIRKKKTPKLDIADMNKIRDGLLGDDSAAHRPVRDLFRISCHV